MAALMKCPALHCCRAGDDAGTCGSFVTCPQTVVPVEPNDVVLRCDLCDITRVIAASRIIQGKQLPAGNDCPVAACECRPIAAKPGKGRPADGTSQEG